MSNQNQDKRSASQKIADLEGAMMNAYQMMNNMASDLQATKKSSQLVGLKLQAAIKLSGLTDEAISAEVTALRAEEMAEEIKLLETQGAITKIDVATEKSLVVGRDLSKDGTGEVINPRIQFVVANLQDAETRAKVVGATVGQTIVFAADKNQFEVLEIYRIGKEETSEGAPEAPASVEATSDTASA